jgi:hypothetical protein
MSSLPVHALPTPASDGVGTSSSVQHSTQAAIPKRSEHFISESGSRVLILRILPYSQNIGRWVTDRAAPRLIHILAV